MTTIIHVANIFQDKAYQKAMWSTHNPTGSDMTVGFLFDIHHVDDGIEIKNGQRDFSNIVVPTEYAKRLFAYFKATGEKASIRAYTGKKGTRVSIRGYADPIYTTQKEKCWLETVCDALEI